jgi:hypothetical protein
MSPLPPFSPGFYGRVRPADLTNWRLRGFGPGNAAVDLAVKPCYEARLAGPAAYGGEA